MNLSLSKKMGFGFGVLIFVAALIGVVSWIGITSLSNMIQQFKLGNQSLELTQEMGSARRDFAIYKNEKLPGKEETAVDLWKHAYNKVEETLGELSQAKGLSKKDQQSIASALAACESYKSAFLEGEEAQATKDSAFKQWGAVGWEVTDQINKLLDNTIKPSLKKAMDSGDACSR